MRSKKVLSLFLVLTLVLTAFCGFGVSASAASPALSKTSIKLIIGESYMLLLNNSGSGVTWSTSNKSVASVNSGVVRGIGKGKATITAKYNSKNYSCTVTVGEYRMDYTSNKVAVGNRLKLDVVGWSGARTWRSSDASIAAVNTDGVVRGINEGTAKITASFGGNILSLNVTVTAFKFPITADKVAYIKFSPRTENAAAYSLAKSVYITDKTKIKNLINYMGKLGYSFVEPDDYAVYRSDIREASTAYSSDTLILYNSSGTELARFESFTSDDDARDSLNVLYYMTKSYLVKNVSGIINQVFGWISYEKLINSARNAVLSRGKTIANVIMLSYVNTVNLPRSLSLSPDGNSYVVKALCLCTDGTYTTVYIDPKTGNGASGSVFGDEDII